MDTVQFVDSISASPTVRLNLNDGVTWGLNYQGTDISPPALKQAWASTLLVDGEKLTAAAYSNRRLKLALDLMTATQDASATQLQALWRELNRPYNLLRWQPEGMTAPVFFRTIRSSSNRVTDYPGGGSLRTVEVEIEAEPFAYGLKETLSTVTVSNDPAAASNGMFLDVASPKGDVETPLFLQIAAPAVAATGRRTSAISVRRGGTPSAAPFHLPAESMVAGTNTALQPNDAVMSGSGSNFMRTTFASTAMLQRLSIATFPASPSVDNRGTYRVFARVRKSVAADTITMRLTANLDGATYSGDEVTLPSVVTPVWVDLGLLQLPLGYDARVDGYSGVPTSVRGVSLWLDAARTAGTGNLDVDGLVFLPADDRLLFIWWPEFSGPTYYIVDAAENQVYGIGASGEIRPTQIPEMNGLGLMVSPAVAARITFMLDVGFTAGGDDRTRTTAITPYYWPRYLAVRPPTT